MQPMISTAASRLKKRSPGSTAAPPIGSSIFVLGTGSTVECRVAGHVRHAWLGLIGLLLGEFRESLVLGAICEQLGEIQEARAKPR